MADHILVPAAEHIRAMPNATDYDHAVADWLDWVADRWVIPKEVRHYSARAEMQGHAVKVAEAVLRLVGESS